jgi:hypothetical protein
MPMTQGFAHFSTFLPEPTWEQQGNEPRGHSFIVPQHADQQER